MQLHGVCKQPKSLRQDRKGWMQFWQCLRKEKSSIKYVALLRGINVGGNTKVPMGDLKKVFEEVGFSDIKTLLNSGNVVFSSKQIKIPELKKELQNHLANVFGWVIEIIIVPQIEIKQLVEDNPFREIRVTPETRLYVTFRTDETQKENVKIPYESPEKEIRILRVSKSEICSVLILSPKRGTVDLMSFIEKEFGKNVTTRNWNTVQKLAGL